MILTLIRCSQGGLSRRGEEVTYEVFTEDECNTLTNLKKVRLRYNTIRRLTFDGG